MDKKLTENLAYMDKLAAKVQHSEKLAYDFRKDLAKNMSEIESHFGKKQDQMARAIQDISRMFSSQDHYSIQIPSNNYYSGGGQSSK